METENQQESQLPSQEQESTSPSPNNTTNTQNSSLTKKINKPLFLGVLAILGIAAFFFLGNNTGNKEDKPKVIPKQENYKSKQVEIEQLPEIIINEESNIIDATTIEELEIEEPNLPPPPPPEDKAPPPPEDIFSTKKQETQSVIDQLFESEKEKRRKIAKLTAKRKANIMVFGGKSIGDKVSKKKRTEDGEEDEDEKTKTKEKEASPSGGFLGFSEGVLDSTPSNIAPSDSVKARQMGDLNYLVAEGKIIYAILETAINSEIPGTLRGVIARDIYAESGRNILIPRGSRIIGKYDSEVKDAQTRIAIIWHRLIRPDGIDIALDSQVVDSLGRAGLSGTLDDHLFARLASSVMISYVIPTAIQKITNNASDEITKTSNTSADTGNTTTTESGTRKAFSAETALNEITQQLKETIKKTIPSKPTFIVPQGRRIEIFVQHDLSFPKEFVD